MDDSRSGSGHLYDIRQLGGVAAGDGLPTSKIVLMLLQSHRQYSSLDCIQSFVETNLDAHLPVLQAMVTKITQARQEHLRLDQYDARLSNCAENLHRVHAETSQRTEG